jgi:cytochrome P450
LAVCVIRTPTIFSFGSIQKWVPKAPLHPKLPCDRKVFLASGSDLIEQVLVTDAQHYIKHFGARAFKPVLGNGLITSEGAFWHRQRKLIQPAFLKARVQSYAPVMAELTNQMLDSWSSGKRVEIDFEFEVLTSKIALKTLFDLDDRGVTSGLMAC